MMMARASDRLLDRLGLALLAAALLACCWLAIARPLYNWDMIPYVALAGESAASSSAQRHAQTYATVRAATPPGDWALLSRGNSYRATQFRDSDAFDSQLGMYRIKAGYVAAARLASRAVPVETAFRLVNVLAFLLILAAASWWMSAGGFAQAAPFIVPAFIISQLHVAGRLVTPDVLCAAFGLLGLALLRRGPWPAGAAFFAAATLVRPDFVLFPLAFLAAALVMRTAVRQALATFAAALAALAIAFVAADHPGWWAHFSFSLVDRSRPLLDPPAFSVALYVDSVARALASNVLGQSWPAMAALLLSGWLLLPTDSGHRPRVANCLFAALMLSLVLRCAAFPLVDQRLYLPTMMMGIMLLAERWSPRFGAARREFAAAH